VRWGLDAAHRAPYGLAGTGQNTWRAGLDRLLLGAAMDEEGLRHVGLALPLDDVDSNEIDLAGRLAELVDRLAAALDAMTGERPLTAWLTTLTTAIDGLTAVSDADAWQAAQCRRELAQLEIDAGERAGSVRLSIADVRAMLADRLKGRPTRANFRTGTLTMCSMVPMRSVPHRVVCLLGLDDGRFPRTAAVDGDDVLARDPLIGERDPRSEDRQLLLDAVLAARETLVLLYTGADPRTNAPRPPAVPVGEILDAADAAMRTADGRPAGAHVVVHHPLQPFDVRNFVAGALGSPQPFSFDAHALRGSVRSTQPRVRPLPFLGAPLPRRPADDDVALGDLVQFLEHPARALLKQRLELTLLRDEPEPSDALTVELTGLEIWAVGDRVLANRLAGVDSGRCVAAERRRGELPPGELGKRVLDRVGAVVEPLVAAAAAVRVGDGRAIDVAVDLGPARLSGTVPTVHGETIVRVEYSRLSAKHRLRAWAQVLALSAAYPETPWTATTIGRAARGDGVQRSVVGPVPAGAAGALLADLVALRERGLAAPLPLAAKTSAAYAEKRHAGMSPANAVERARVEWLGGTYDGENADEAHRVVWGERAPLSALLAEPAPADERADEWPDDGSRFAALARRLWEPLLAAETLDTL
jgi:exodeoxyribonuclease V gamma subunit